MQPSGTVGLIGFATSPLFLRDAFEKAGIEAQFVARGEYKSAANIFTEDGYTEAHREADARMVESLAAQVWEGVAASRNLDVAAVDALADRAPLLRDDAVAGAWSTGSASVTKPTDGSPNWLGSRGSAGQRGRTAAAVSGPLCPDRSA